jgi:hypothetical protein
MRIENILQQFALWQLGDVKDRLKPVHQRRNVMVSARWCTAFRRSSAIMRIAEHFDHRISCSPHYSGFWILDSGFLLFP